MNYDVLAVGAFEANCVIVWDDAKQAIVIDPGAEPGELIGFIRDHGLTPVRIVLTHGHIDHVSALDGLLAAFPVPVTMQPEDAAWAFSPVNRIAPYLVPPARPATLDISRPDGDVLVCGDLQARLLRTPGHTPGGCCLWFESEKLLVTGDTLFAGSVGRTDLPGGDWSVLARSLTRLTDLPADTRVLPGHGSSTTIGQEKRTNPYLRPA